MFRCKNFRLTLKFNNYVFYLFIYKPPADNPHDRHMQWLHKTITLIKPLIYIYIYIYISVLLKFNFIRYFVGGTSTLVFWNIFLSTQYQPSNIHFSAKNNLFILIYNPIKRLTHIINVFKSYHSVVRQDWFYCNHQRRL
jgi:hypothetical protein